MRYKPNWPEAQKRLTALWHGELLDRPCISVKAPQPIVDPLLVPEPADDEARWLAPEYVVPMVVNAVKATWWGGEAMPGHFLMACWVDCLGGTPRFDSRTIWFDIQTVDFSMPPAFRHDAASQWSRKYIVLLEAMWKAAGKDDFCVPPLPGLPANDVISMLMGTENFLMALMDRPEWMAEAIMTGARDRIALGKFLQELARKSGHAFWYGLVGWMPFWAPEPFAVMQSDVSCMLSPEQFDKFVLPELELTAAELGPIWYHLDGGNARQHLPRLLALPFLRVLQYTPAPFEPPNGPAHMEMYKLAQAAGKIVHIDVPLEHVEPLVRELDLTLLMLQTHCACSDEGERLLEQAVKWTLRR